MHYNCFLYRIGHHSSVVGTAKIGTAEIGLVIVGCKHVDKCERLLIILHSFSIIYVIESAGIDKITNDY